MLSINSRLLLASGIILIAFFGLTGYTLYNVFRDNLQDAYFEKLHSQVYALIAASEIRDDGTLALAESLPEMQLSIANSGFYGQITRNDGQVVWRSASMVKREIPFRTNLGFGQQVQQILTDSTGQLLYSASFGILWDESRPLTHGFTYSVAELPESYNAQLKLFGEKLLGSLSAVAVILLLAQTALLRWSLTPLRQVTRELKAIEDGVQHNLRGEYPKELLGLTDNINGLLRTQHEHLERYRHSLADLAHSLKTPLALLRGAVETGGTMKYINQTIEDQIDRMYQIIGY